MATSDLAQQQEPQGWNSDYLYLSLEDYKDRAHNKDKYTYWEDEFDSDGKAFLTFANGWYMCITDCEDMYLVFNHFCCATTGREYTYMVRIKKAQSDIVELVAGDSFSKQKLKTIPGFRNKRKERGVTIWSFNRGIIHIPEIGDMTKFAGKQ